MVDLSALSPLLLHLTDRFWPYLYVMVHIVDSPGARLPTVGCSCSKPSRTMKSCSFSRSLRGRLGSTQFSTSTPTPISPTLCRSHSTGKLPAKAEEASRQLLTYQDTCEHIPTPDTCEHIPTPMSIPLCRSHSIGKSYLPKQNRQKANIGLSQGVCEATHPHPNNMSGSLDELHCKLSAQEEVQGVC